METVQAEVCSAIKDTEVRRPTARPMMVAAAAGRVAEVRNLLQAGADPTSQDDRGSAVHSAAINGRTEVLEVLAAAGADLDVLDYNKATPLMAACIVGLKKGSKAALKLIELGADVKYVRKSDGANALCAAATRAEPEVIKALVRRGALVDGRRRDPITPLMRAALEGNIQVVKVLLALGADTERKCLLPWAGRKTAGELARHYRKMKVAEFLKT